jgi:uncharacterized OB-fold protein
MKTPKEILEECLSYYNVEGLVQEGSRLWMAIIDAMRTFAKDEPEQKPLTGWICPRCGKVIAPFITECEHIQTEYLTKLGGGTKDE